MSILVIRGLLAVLLCGVSLAVWPQVSAPQGQPVDLPGVIRQTLARNPAIQLQERQVEVARGSLQQSSGQFDPVLQVKASRSRDNQPLSGYYQRYYTAAYGKLMGQVSALQSDSTSLAVALEKPLRNGMVLSSSLSTTRSEGTSNDFYGLAPQNLGVVNFSLTLPLLKGSGDAAAAGESASDLEWQASRQDLRQTVAQNLLNGVSAYWRLLAAGNNLTIAQEGEAGMVRLLEDTRKLISADELPAAEINLIQAHLADRRSARIAAEQNLLQARQTLGAVMGLPYPEIARLEAAGDFSPLPRELPRLVGDVRALVEQALIRRPDLEAARLRQEAALVLSDAARTNLKPQLDLNLGIGYAGLSEGSGGRHYYNALGENTTGANAGVTLTYQWSLGNNGARGNLAQRSGIYDQATLNHLNLARSISLAVDATLAGLVRSALQLQASEESVAIYRISLENEKIKNRLGSSTILDVLSVDDSLRNARLANVNYHLAYQIALATLGYETGTLIDDDPAVQSVNLAQFIDMPRVAGVLE